MDSEWQSIEKPTTTLSFTFSNSDDVEDIRKIIRNYDPDATDEFDPNASKITFHISKLKKENTKSRESFCIFIAIISVYFLSYIMIIYPIFK